MMISIEIAIKLQSSVIPKAHDVSFNI